MIRWTESKCLNGYLKLNWSAYQFFDRVNALDSVAVINFIFIWIELKKRIFRLFFLLQSWASYSIINLSMRKTIGKVFFHPFSFIFYYSSTEITVTHTFIKASIAANDQQSTSEWPLGWCHANKNVVNFTTWMTTLSINRFSWQTD